MLQHAGTGWTKLFGTASTLQFAHPSGAFIGFALNPKGLSLRNAFLSSARRCRASPAMLAPGSTGTLSVRLPTNASNSGNHRMILSHSVLCLDVAGCLGLCVNIMKMVVVSDLGSKRSRVVKKQCHDTRA